MIDAELALSAPATSRPFSWEPRDVILYHLGLGAGSAPGSATGDQLDYLYEPRLKVLPSFATIPAGPAVHALNEREGIDVDFGSILHGEHSLRLLRPLPTAAECTVSSRVTEVSDKGRSALVELEVNIADADGPLAVNRYRLMIRGEGGSGRPGVKTFSTPVPNRAPDAVVESAIAWNQALLYRLSGDSNPLHADPVMAAEKGFPRPILHGLSTFGMVCLATVEKLLDGDVERISGMDARFSGVVYPGETLISRMWRTESLIQIEVATVDRGEPLLSNATVFLSR